METLSYDLLQFCLMHLPLMDTPLLCQVSKAFQLAMRGSKPSVMDAHETVLDAHETVQGQQDQCENVLAPCYLLRAKHSLCSLAECVCIRRMYSRGMFDHMWSNASPMLPVEGGPCTAALKRQHTFPSFWQSQTYPVELQALGAQFLFTMFAGDVLLRGDAFAPSPPTLKSNGEDAEEIERLRAGRAWISWQAIRALADYCEWALALYHIVFDAYHVPVSERSPQRLHAIFRSDPSEVLEGLLHEVNTRPQETVLVSQSTNLLQITDRNVLDGFGFTWVARCTWGMPDAVEDVDGDWLLICDFVLPQVCNLLMANQTSVFPFTRLSSFVGIPGIGWRDIATVVHLTGPYSYEMTHWWGNDDSGGVMGEYVHSSLAPSVLHAQCGELIARWIESSALATSEEKAPRHVTWYKETMLHAYGYPVDYDTAPDSDVSDAESVEYVHPETYMHVTSDDDDMDDMDDGDWNV